MAVRYTNVSWPIIRRRNARGVQLEKKFKWFKYLATTSEQLFTCNWFIYTSWCTAIWFFSCYWVHVLEWFVATDWSFFCYWSYKVNKSAYLCSIAHIIALDFWPFILKKLHALLCRNLRLLDSLPCLIFYTFIYFAQSFSFCHVNTYHSQELKRLWLHTPTYLNHYDFTHICLEFGVR